MSPSATYGVAKGGIVDSPTSALYHGAYSAIGYFAGGANTSSYRGAAVALNASRSSSIYSDSVTTVQPSSITLIPQIRY